MAEDPFAVLGLDEGATDQQVKSAFRRMALRCHPDRHPKDALAKARFIRLGRAREALLDPSKRRAAARQRGSQSRPQQQSAQENTKKKKTQAQVQAEKRKRAAAKKAETERRVAAERLQKREMEAAAKKQKAAQAAAEAKRRYEEMAAEANARELAAERERQKAGVFDAYLRKKHARREPPKAASEPTHSPLVALVERFARSGECTLEVLGPLATDDRAALMSTAEAHGLLVTEESAIFLLSRPRDRSASSSPWEPPGGTRNGRAFNRRRTRERTTKTSSASACGESASADRHQAAIQRLHARRNSGEGLPRTPVGSWWVHDEEAERWTKYVDRCGF